MYICKHLGNVLNGDPEGLYIWALTEDMVKSSRSYSAPLAEVWGHRVVFMKNLRCFASSDEQLVVGFLICGGYAGFQGPVQYVGDLCRGKDGVKGPFPSHGYEEV